MSWLKRKYKRVVALPVPETGPCEHKSTWWMGYIAKGPLEGDDCCSRCYKIRLTTGEWVTQDELFHRQDADRIEKKRQRQLLLRL